MLITYFDTSNLSIYKQQVYKQSFINFLMTRLSEKDHDKQLVKQMQLLNSYTLKAVTHQGVRKKSLEIAIIYIIKV